MRQSEKEGEKSEAHGLPFNLEGEADRPFKWRRDNPNPTRGRRVKYFFKFHMEVTELLRMPGVSESVRTPLSATWGKGRYTGPTTSGPLTVTV